MSGASIAGMLQSLRSNRNILKGKHKPFEKHPSKEAKIHIDLNFKEASPETTRLFLQRFKNKKQKEHLIRISIWMAGIVAVAITFYFILN